MREFLEACYEYIGTVAILTFMITLAVTEIICAVRAKIGK